MPDSSHVMGLGTVSPTSLGESPRQGKGRDDDEVTIEEWRRWQPERAAQTDTDTKKGTLSTGNGPIIYIQEDNGMQRKETAYYTFINCCLVELSDGAEGRHWLGS